MVVDSVVIVLAIISCPRVVSMVYAEYAAGAVVMVMVVVPGLG